MISLYSEDVIAKMSPTASFARSLLTLRHRDQQVHSMDGHDSPDSDPLLSFDRHVSTLLLSLLPSGDQTPFLSISWINDLLRSFLLLLDEFNALVFTTKLPNCPLLDRSISDFFDRSVKALDILNAVRDGLDRVRHYRVHLDTALSSFAKGQLHRATKSLALIAAEDSSVVPAHRNRSFTHFHHHHHQLRTLSWNVSVSRNWSASRQLHSIVSNLTPPKPADVSATGGLAVPIFTLSSLLLFVLWTLVAAVPCQDRGLHAHLSAPRSYPWAAPMISLQEKILDESRKKKNDNVSGLMKEICTVEKGARSLMGLLAAERVEDRENEVRELEEARKGLKEGLEGLDRQVREMFLRIVRSRADGLDCLSR